MKVQLNIEDRQKQRDFLDYLNSALRDRMPNYRGEAGRDDTGAFLSSVFGGFQIDETKVDLRFQIHRAANGTLTDLEVVPIGETCDEAKWQSAAYEFVTSVLATALADARKSFFRRNLFYFIGPQLDGEYWLPGFRFAPIVTNDPMPQLINGERVTTIDQVIDAIDDMHASALANEAARRLAARLSLLLNVGLYGSDHSMRWVMLQDEDGSVSDSIRCHVGYSRKDANVSEMPKKGEICPLGDYKGSLVARYRVAGELQSLPPQARNEPPRVFRRLFCVSQAAIA